VAPDAPRRTPADPVVTRLAELLPHAATAPGDVSPRLSLGKASPLRAYVSRNHHQQARRLRNRLARDGHDLEIRQLEDTLEIAKVLPEVVAVCRARDHQLRRHSGLDSGPGLAFFNDVVAEHAAGGAVALTTLRLDGALAAYVLCFKDGGAWRMWNCRFAPTWAEYGPGRLSHDASLEAAIEQGCTLYDWMRGDENYKYALSDHVYRAADMFAASNALVWAACEFPRRTRAALRDAKNGSTAATWAWGCLRRLQQTLLHPPGTRSAPRAAGSRRPPATGIRWKSR
jgi:CelD/BcsL family acetyltransferase involved in cellulose biosynthesis